MLKFTARLCLVSLCLSGLLAAAAQGQEPLSWRFAVGDHYKVIHESSSNVANETDEERHVDQRTVYLDWQVTAVDADGNGTILCAIDRLTSSQSGASFEDYEIDTANPAELEGRAAEEAASLERYLNVTFEFDMSPRGEFLEIRLDEESREILLEDDPHFEPHLLLNLLEAGWLVLPELSVEPGDSWETQMRFPGLEPHIESDTVCTYKEQGEGEAISVAQIELETTLAIVEDRERFGDAPPEITAQECTASASFDLAAGYLQACNTEFAFETHFLGRGNDEFIEQFRWTITPAEE